MPRYKDIKLTGATKVGRRHARDVNPPGLVTLENAYISRSDNVPQVRPKLTTIADTLTSIPGTSDSNDEADWLNSYFYSWGANAGFYLTKYGPIYASGDSNDTLYSTYDAGTFSCDSSNTSIVTFNGEDADVLVNVWPGCLLLYSGTYYTFEAIVDATTAVLETSPGAVEEGACTIIRIHNPDRAAVPFNISQYGVNMVYSTPYYRLPMDSSKISGPFYLPFNDYKTSSPWKDTSSSVTFSPDVYGFTEWLAWHPTHAYERAGAWRSAVPLVWNTGSVSSIYSVSSSIGLANTNLLPPGSQNIDGDVTARYTTIDIFNGYPTSGPIIVSDDFESQTLSAVPSGWTVAATNGSPTGSWLVVSESSLFAGQELVVKRTGAYKDGYSLLGNDSSLGTNQIVTAHVGASISDATSTSEVGVASRITGTTGYVAFVFMQVGQVPVLYIQKVSGSTATPIANQGMTGTIGNHANTTTYQIKFETTGTTLRAKLWVDGTTEPSSWTLSTTDSTYTRGSAGVFARWNENGIVTATINNYVDDFSAQSSISVSSTKVNSMAYGSEADGELGLYCGLDDGVVVKLPLTAGYGANNEQHFTTISSTSAPVVYENSGSRTTINRIRDVGYTNISGDSEVWAVCDAGIILHNLLTGNEVDIGAIGNLYDVASSRRPDAAADPEGDVVVVGEAGVIYYLAAEDDPDTAGNWTSATSGTDNDLNRCYYSKYNNKFLAVSWAGDVILSDDAGGTAWTAKTTPSSGYAILDCACDEEGRIFLFVCTDNKAYATTDFTTYTDVTPSSLDTETLLSCTYCLREGKFVVGGSGGYIEDVRLTHGIDATAALVGQLQTAGQTISAVQYFNSLFIASRGAGVFSTPGGTWPWTWTSEFVTAGKAALKENGTSIMAVYQSGSNVVSNISADGTTWTGEVTIDTAVSGDTDFFVDYDTVNSKWVTSYNGSLWFSADGSAWTEVDISGYSLVGVLNRTDAVSAAFVLLLVSESDPTKFKSGTFSGGTYAISAERTVSSTQFDLVDSAALIGSASPMLPGARSLNNIMTVTTFNDQATQAATETVRHSELSLDISNYSDDYTSYNLQWKRNFNYDSVDGVTVFPGYFWDGTTAFIGLTSWHGNTAHFKSCGLEVGSGTINYLGCVTSGSAFYLFVTRYFGSLMVTDVYSYDDALTIEAAAI